MTSSIKRLTLLFLIVLTASAASNAQSNYKPGYVVDLKGDTIKGSIDYREWEKNPAQISFKNVNGNLQDYNPLNCAGFAVNGFEYYEKYRVKISRDTVDLTKLSRKRDTSYRTETVFLRTMVKGGNLSLYSYTDDVKTRYYILEQHGVQPEELAYHAYMNEEGANAVHVNRYRVQLQYEAQKYGAGDALQTIISRADYADKDITSIVTKINGGKNDMPVVESRYSAKWFAGAAVNVNSMEFHGANQAFAEGTKKNSVSPQINGGVDIFPFNGVQKLFIRFDLGLSYSQYSFSQDDPNSFAIGKHEVLDIKQYNIIISPQIGYNLYNQPDLKLFISVGGAAYISSYNKYQYIITYSTISPQIKDGYPAADKTWYGFPINLGATINKKFEVYVTGIKRTTMITGDTGGFSYGAGFNYYFGGK